MILYKSEKINIKNLRKLLTSQKNRAKGYKNLYVAEKAGYTPQELSDMLNGRKLIKACDIPNLAFALGVKTDELYEAGKEVVSEGSNGSQRASATEEVSEGGRLST